jgi:hypothetical protein
MLNYYLGEIIPFFIYGPQKVRGKAALRVG